MDRPQLGLQSLRWQGTPHSVHVLGVRWESDGTDLLPGRDPHWPLLVEDAYVRADDLVATYRPEPPLPYRPQIYWRADTLGQKPPVPASLSLLVSIQTDLLDTRPQLNVVSHLVAQNTAHLTMHGGDCRTNLIEGVRTQVFQPQPGMNCVLLRLPGQEYSYAECAAAADFRELWISPPNDETHVAKVEWQLFNDFLEKGVIRRAQVHAVFLPRASDEQLLAEYCRTIKNKPLPLTT